MAEDKGRSKRLLGSLLSNLSGQRAAVPRKRDTHISPSAPSIDELRQKREEIRQEKLLFQEASLLKAVDEQGSEVFYRPRVLLPEQQKIIDSQLEALKARKND